MKPENNQDPFFNPVNILNKIIPSSGFDFEYDGWSEDKEEKPKKKLFFEIKELVEESKLNKIKRLKAKIEAILFLSEKPLSANSIAIKADTDEELVSQCLNQLTQEYEDRDSGIIIDYNNGYCMQVRDEFEELVGDLLPIEIRSAVLRTLSTIALKEPILQKDLVEIRGGGIYEHVKELIDMGLVKKSKSGNSHVIHTTKFFSENFKLSQNGIELQTVLKKAAPGEVEFVRPAALNAIVNEESSAEDIVSDS